MGFQFEKKNPRKCSENRIIFFMYVRTNIIDELIYNVCCEQNSRFVLLNKNQHETILTNARSETFILPILNNQVIDFKESKHNLIML